MSIIKIADKPTLDEVKENTELIKNELSQSNRGGYECISLFEENAVILNTAKYVSYLPYEFYMGGAVVYNNEIHILGGYNNYMKHYKWNGSSWTEVSTVPNSNIFGGGCAVVYNNEIHILGGVSAGATKHHKWNGSSWTEVSTLPYGFWKGCAVVYNNEIHILGGESNNTKHYKWDGSSWTEVSTLPYDFYDGSAVVYNNEIHILGCIYTSSNSIKHYKWNGSSWTSVSTLPYTFSSGCAVVYNDEIHILGTNVNGDYKNHYKWNGSSWTEVSTLPYEFYYGCAVVYNDKIHILGTNYGSTYTKHYHYIVEYSANQISLYLLLNNKIICNKEKILPISDNLKKIDNGYVCTQTGLCKLYSELNNEDLLFTII